MSQMETVDQDLVDMIETVLATHRAGLSERDPGRFDAELWATLDGVGLTRLTGAEASGGSGATWREAAVLLGSAAAHAAAVPLGEHDLLAGWLLEQAGMEPAEGSSTAALLDSAGEAHGVAWGDQVEWLVLSWERGGQWLVAKVPSSTVTVAPGTNLAGQPRPSVAVDVSSLAGIPVGPSTPTEFLLRGALARCLQVCGAMERIVELCERHATHRVQFGRPLTRFQAVQHLIADVAAESALARAATAAAVAEAAASDFTSPTLPFSVAAARSCAGHAAGTVVRNAHQVHGAIGTTLEHELQEFTKPVLAWRGEFGSMRYWDEFLTDLAIDAGRNVWSLVANGVPAHLPPSGGGWPRAESLPRHGGL
jgi:acyl-CoA dehydrogenase